MFMQLASVLHACQSVGHDVHMQREQRSPMAAHCVPPLPPWPPVPDPDPVPPPAPDVLPPRGSCDVSLPKQAGPRQNWSEAQPLEQLVRHCPSAHTVPASVQPLHPVCVEETHPPPMLVRRHR
jgi:hypothetical protein